MAVALDAVSGVTGQYYNTALSSSHTCAGSNRLLIVATGIGGGFGGQVTGVTYGGVPLTLLTSLGSGTQRKEYVYYMVNPPAGTATIQVSFTASDDGKHFAAASFNGALQSAPTYTITSGNGTVTTAVASAVNDIVFGYAFGHLRDGGFASPFTSHTHLAGNQWNGTTNWDVQHQIATAPGTGSNVTASVTSIEQFLLAAVRVAQAVGNPPIDGTGAVTLAEATTAGAGAIGNLLWRVPTSAADGTTVNLTILNDDRTQVLAKGVSIAAGGYFTIPSSYGVGTKKLATADTWAGNLDSVAITGGVGLATVVAT